jgi:hypothetical protein
MAGSPVPAARIAAVRYALGKPELGSGEVRDQEVLRSGGCPGPQVFVAASRTGQLAGDPPVGVYGQSWCVRAWQRLWPVVAGESGMVSSLTGPVRAADPPGQHPGPA